ncbi:MAG: 7-cyano-7-deazaguanine synthase [Pirellulaceae bacterium]|nr:7-cyano-7-deazaguanine synthase [Pirellulaceae bacterium]
MLQKLIRKEDKKVGVLVSGGLDSCAMLWQFLAKGCEPYPLYVQSGFRWEEAELASLRRFLAVAHLEDRLKILSVPMDDLLGDHWGFGKEVVPDDTSDDQEVWLPGRNLFLLSKAAIWCQIARIGHLALGTLAGNPFSDATGEYLEKLESLLADEPALRIRLCQPFARKRKADLLRSFPEVPFNLTFSCIDPVNGRHCGRCNKCAERQSAFREASISDKTEYERQLCPPAGLPSE